MFLSLARNETPSSQPSLNLINSRSPVWSNYLLKYVVYIPAIVIPAALSLSRVSLSLESLSLLLCLLCTCLAFILLNCDKKKIFTLCHNIITWVHQTSIAADVHQPTTPTVGMLILSPLHNPIHTHTTLSFLPHKLIYLWPCVLSTHLSSLCQAPTSYKYLRPVHRFHLWIGSNAYTPSANQNHPSLDLRRRHGPCWPRQCSWSMLFIALYTSIDRLYIFERDHLEPITHTAHDQAGHQLIPFIARTYSISLYVTVYYYAFLNEPKARTQLTRSHNQGQNTAHTQP